MHKVMFATGQWLCRRCLRNTVPSVNASVCQCHDPDMYIQHSLSYAVRNFHLNWLTFLEAMMDVLGVHFLSGHSVYSTMETENTKALGRQRAKPSKINA